MSKQAKKKAAAKSAKAAAKPAKRTAAAKKPAPKKRETAKTKVAAKSRSAPPKSAERTVLTANTKAPQKKMAARPKPTTVVLPPDYRPSEDEPFMNELQRVYFRQKLLNWKEEILRQTRETLVGLHEDSTQHADLADRATSETDRALELRARDRQRKLISKIDAALARIEDGTYGYCEETGEPIGLKRLDARPIATLSVEAQERHERRERVYRED
jgi:DnaK suppressor protein